MRSKLVSKLIALSITLEKEEVTRLAMWVGARRGKDDPHIIAALYDALNQAERQTERD